MAEISSTQLNEIIQRVTSEIQQEAKAEEAKGFGVADLQAQLRDLVKTGGGGAERAWTVKGSYDTSDGPKIESVWKVSGSYDTSDGPRIETIWKVGGGYSTLAGPSLSRAWKVECSYDTSSGTVKPK